MGVDTGDKQSILFVARRRRAQSFLTQLRETGHRVSLVEDLDDAADLVPAGGFQFSILPAESLAQLLAERREWERSGVEERRHAMQALTAEVEAVLHCLRQTFDAQAARGAAAGGGDKEIAHTVALICSYLSDLSAELGCAGDDQVHISVFDLEEAIETAAVTAYPLASERRQRLVIDIEEGLGAVRGDRAKIKRALASLLAYAASHSPRKGTVTVRCYREQGEVIVSVRFAAEEMSRQELRRLFPVSAGAPGAALTGLQRLVELHGCRFWLESERGRGTSLFLSLPSWADTSSSNVALIQA